ncbi:ScbR family autoregulator-binding transcription factor [Streptomyces sp. NPDC048269]|uniref:ScbR family autoregulator-binding transcription factor n=1 Tax=Streptomyces sp. NPDC048269 TaxID=3155753 RepID=UPI0034166C66
MVKQERAARTREALIRAAAEIFAEEGFVTASIATISRKAGVSAGGLHFHFGSKTELAEAVQGRAVEAVRRITAAAPGRSGGALQLLIDGVHGLAALLAHDVVVRAGFGLCADWRRDTGCDLRRIWQGWVQDVFRAAERDEQLADGVSAEDAALAVVAATVGFEVLGAGEPDWVSHRSLTRFWALLLPRLAAQHVLGGLVAAGSGREEVPGPQAADRPVQRLTD